MGTSEDSADVQYSPTSPPGLLLPVTCALSRGGSSGGRGSVKSGRATFGIRLLVCRGGGSAGDGPGRDKIDATTTTTTTTATTTAASAASSASAASASAPAAAAAAAAGVGVGLARSGSSMATKEESPSPPAPAPADSTVSSAKERAGAAAVLAAVKDQTTAVSGVGGGSTGFQKGERTLDNIHDLLFPLDSGSGSHTSPSAGTSDGGGLDFSFLDDDGGGMSENGSVKPPGARGSAFGESNSVSSGGTDELLNAPLSLSSTVTTTTRAGAAVNIGHQPPHLPLSTEASPLPGANVSNLQTAVLLPALAIETIASAVPREQETQSGGVESTTPDPPLAASGGGGGGVAGGGVDSVGGVDVGIGAGVDVGVVVVGDITPPSAHGNPPSPVSVSIGASVDEYYGDDDFESFGPEAAALDEPGDV